MFLTDIAPGELSKNNIHIYSIRQESLQGERKKVRQDNSHPVPSIKHADPEKKGLDTSHKGRRDRRSEQWWPKD